MLFLKKEIFENDQLKFHGFEPRILIWILEYMDGTCTLIIKCQLCGICSVTDDTNAYIPFSNPESIDAVISILQRAKYINFTSKNEPQKTE